MRSRRCTPWIARDTHDDVSAAGRLRTMADDVAVIDVRNNEVIYTPPPAQQLEKRMKLFVEYANAPAEGDFARISTPSSRSSALSHACFAPGPI